MKIRGFQEVSENHKKIDSKTILPTRGSKDSAGYDFYSKERITILPGDKHVFWTDVKAYMQEGEVLKMFVRSSIGIKKGLILSNSTGIIDKDYYSNESNDGNIGVCLRNLSSEPQSIDVDERIAQGIFETFLVADNGNTEEERKGGIGSTNK
jgi:dUTP pyrophosphatase